MLKIFEQLSEIGIAQAKIIKDLQERVDFLEEAFLLHTKILKGLVDDKRTVGCSIKTPESN